MGSDLVFLLITLPLLVCLIALYVIGCKRAYYKGYQAVYKSLKNTKFKKMILCKQCEQQRNFEGRVKEFLINTNTERSFACRLCGSKEGYVEYEIPNLEAQQLLNERNRNKVGIDKLKFRFLGE